MHTALARLVILLTGLHWTASDWYSRNMRELHSFDAQRYSEVGAFFRLPYRNISLSLGRDRSTRNWTCITPILVGRPYRDYWVRETWDWKTSSTRRGQSADVLYGEMCLHLLGITIIRYRYENWKSYLYYIIDDYGYTQLRSPVPSTPSIMACRDACSSNWSYAVGVLVVSYSSYQQSHFLLHLWGFTNFRALPACALDFMSWSPQSQPSEALARLNLIRRNFVISTPSKIETLGATIQIFTINVARTYEDGSFRRFPRRAHWCFGWPGSGARRADTLAWHFPCSCQIATL